VKKMPKTWPNRFFSKLTLLPWKKGHKILATCVNNRPIGEKWLNLVTLTAIRVTRLGEFSPIGWLLTLGSYLQNHRSTPNSCATFFQGKSY
jgi:hypothetical protein